MGNPPMKKALKYKNYVLTGINKEAANTLTTPKSALQTLKISSNYTQNLFSRSKSQKFFHDLEQPKRVLSLRLPYKTNANLQQILVQLQFAASAKT